MEFASGLPRPPSLDKEQASIIQIQGEEQAAIFPGWHIWCPSGGGAVCKWPKYWQIVQTFYLAKSTLLAPLTSV